MRWVDMHAFAALIDALIYTRSRNAKLKLIGDYLIATPRSRSRLGDGGADRRLGPAGGEVRCHPRADRGADRSRAVPDESRLCRRYRGDGGAAVACAADARRPRTAVDRGGGRPVAQPVAIGCARRAGGDARPVRRGGAVCAAEDGDGGAADRRLVAAGEDRVGDRVRYRRRCGGGGLARPDPTLCVAVCLGRRAR